MLKVYAGPRGGRRDTQVPTRQPGLIRRTFQNVRGRVVNAINRFRGNA
jgi:hypothetical protein